MRLLLRRSPPGELLNPGGLTPAGSLFGRTWALHKPNAVRLLPALLGGAFGPSRLVEIVSPFFVSHEMEGRRLLEINTHQGVQILAKGFESELINSPDRCLVNTGLDSNCR